MLRKHLSLFQSKGSLRAKGEWDLLFLPDLFKEKEWEWELRKKGKKRGSEGGAPRASRFWSLSYCFWESQRVAEAKKSAF